MLWAVLVAVICVLLLWNYARGEDSPLDIIPGPPKRAITGHIHVFFRVSATKLFELMREFAKNYGDRYLIKIFRRRILHVTNPKDIELLLNHPKNITKNKPYMFLKPWLGTGLLLSTGSKWRKRRKILTPTFHFNILKNFAGIIEDKSRGLVERLGRSAGAELSLFPVVSDFTLYTICETAMGTQLDKDDSSASREYKENILEMGRLMVTRLTRIWLHFDIIFKNHPIGKQFYQALDIVHNFADNVILERKRHNQKSSLKTEKIEVEGVMGSKKRLAMLDLLLEAESKGEIDLEGIREEVNTFMFEGHDTTATAITFGLMLLADHEDVQDRIFEECQSILGDQRPPSVAELSGMKYLEAAVKETLRLYPPVPFIARYISEEFMLDDVRVPKGSEMAVHIFDLHRREDLYPDPEAFRPERFLDGSSRHPYAFVPFSAGSRNCIGQRFAMQELKCVFSEIVRNFKLVPRTKGWRPRLTADMVLRSEDPIYVKFVRR